MSKRTLQVHDLRRVQNIRKVVLLLALIGAVTVISVGASRWSSGSVAHEVIEWIGIALIVFCIIGRTWTSLYIGGRKNNKLVQYGPYSISRNPLYLFTFIGAAGMGAQLGSLSLALMSAFVPQLPSTCATFLPEIRSIP
jgi:protein-S-isoprenylcysteine O-methyltransferase Ste14